MRKSTIILLVASLICTATGRAFSQDTPTSAQYSEPVIVPAASKIGMQLIRPVWSANAKAGDIFYAITVDPVTAGNLTAIPSGTYVEGTISSFTKPTAKSEKSIFHLRFDKLIFPNGYTVVLTKPSVRSLVTVKVSTRNDLLLDNGAELAMTLHAPLTLDGEAVAQAVPLAQPPDSSAFVPATLCRFIPGTPGDPGSPATPDTVIPGNPGSPGTPDTVIPGADGAPDTVIPGIPATPATPDTVIHGSPAVAPTPPTPPIYCPDPPTVISSVLELGTHTAAKRTSLALTK